MLNVMARNWWLFALRGVLAILFGLMAWIWPGITLQVLTLIFAAYAFVDGIFTVTSAFSPARKAQRGWLLLEGVLEILAGIITFFWPAITILALLYIIAAYAFIGGILEIIFAIQVRRLINNEWLLILIGALSIIFSIMLVIFPGSSLLGFVWLIGIYAIMYGILLIGLAFRLNRWHRDNRLNRPEPV
jgi:uncharacterized membrane protein HdeD (DUF308 family)